MTTAHEALLKEKQCLRREESEMKKKVGVRIAASALLLGVLGVCLSAFAEDTSTKRPNIVFALADDMGYSDPGFLGGDIETPNLDRLAEEGTFYSRFYNHAKCEPSRASLLTGVHYHRQTYFHVLLDYRGVTTIAAELKKAGYFTACTGKWHLPKRPAVCGFDRSYGLVMGAANHFDPTGRLGLDGKVYMFKTMLLDNRPVEVTDEDYYSADAATDYALRFLKERPEGKPFFLYLSYRTPHWPLQAPEEDIAKYADRYTGGWGELRAARTAHLRKAGVFPAGWTLPPRDPEVGDWADWPKQEDAARCMAVHAAMVDRMDQQIGRVLDYLKETGELDNTLICFTSDNGVSGAMGFDRTPDKPAGAVDSFRVLPLGYANAVNTPFVKYKTYNSNGGICSPLIIRWPERFQAGAVSHKPVNILDMMPTFLETAGADYPPELRPLDGHSLFSENSAPMFFWYHKQKAVIDWPWKAWCDAGEWRLFNLNEDPAEADNLAAQNPEKLQQLVTEYTRFDQAALDDQQEFEQTKEAIQKRRSAGRRRR
jgi:arylsulfatase